MAAFDPATLDRWRALAIVDRDGTTVGTISEFYLDRETGHPTWALVNTGLFGTSQTFVPLVDATEIADGLRVPYEKRHIKDAPNVDLHDELTPEEEAALFAHYGVDYEPAAEAPAAEGSAADDPGAEAPAVAGDGEPVRGEPPGPVAAAPVAAEPPRVADAGPGDTLGTVPPEPGSTDPTTVAEGEGGPVPVGATEALPVPHDPAEADGGHHAPDVDTVTAGVPDEPGSAAPSDPVPVDGDRIGPEGAPRTEAGLGAEAGSRAEAGSGAQGAGTGTGIDQLRDSSADPHQPLDGPHDPDRPPHGPHDPDQFRDRGGDPDLGRTAPVEPGLPGSTAASPYGAPTTVDKGDGPSGHPADEPVRAPSEAGWAPGAVGSFEEHEPVDPPAGASDRWREAKLAAERDRIARAAAAQPEERSPLERARRRLERLVGVGQEPTDHDGQERADHDEISPADREAAERARRARLGLDEEDDRRH
jgi:PRC-barrel domain